MLAIVNTTTMIGFEYRFPLFDSLLVGSLNPFLPQNGYRVFVDDLQVGVGLTSVPDNGKYGFRFYSPTNFKCSYYYHKLVPETFLYCNELLAYLADETDFDTRAYLRLTLLDKHLKTCLMRIGELIQTNCLQTNSFLKPTVDTDPEQLSNSYILHLLKLCVAKAYLEIQFALLDVVVNPLSESMLYTALVGEIPPANCLLKQLSLLRAETPLKTPQNASINSTAPIAPSSIPSDTNELPTMVVDTKLYTINDLVKLKIGSDKTIRRLLEKGVLRGFKQGKTWRVEDAELQRYLIQLKTSTKNKI